jgi:hypothetical protein
VEVVDQSTVGTAQAIEPLTIHDIEVWQRLNSSVRRGEKLCAMIKTYQIQDHLEAFQGRLQRFLCRASGLLISGETEEGAIANIQEAIKECLATRDESLKDAAFGRSKCSSDRAKTTGHPSS